MKEENPEVDIVEYVLEHYEGEKSRKRYCRISSRTF